MHYCANHSFQVVGFPEWGHKASSLLLSIIHLHTEGVDLMDTTKSAREHYEQGRTLRQKKMYDQALEALHHTTHHPNYGGQAQILYEPWDVMARRSRHCGRRSIPRACHKRSTHTVCGSH